VKVSTRKPATPLRTRFGQRARTISKLITLVAFVGVTTAAVVAAVVGGLLVAARELQ